MKRCATFEMGETCFTAGIGEKEVRKRAEETPPELCLNIAETLTQHGRYYLCNMGETPLQHRPC
ncbi:MAG: hypothetical protein IKM62_00710 [Kiritimatiellae bacterium]|nr:hypothetical protein [Kiritimatiellia bacterium]